MKKILLSLILLICFSGALFSQSFMKSTIDGSTSEEPYTIASGHLSNDAYLDIAIGTDTGSDVSWYKNDGDVDMDGVGDGTFTFMGVLTADGANALSYVEGMEIADINGDGDEDILATSYVNNNLVWFENNGNDTFQDAVELSDGISGAGMVQVVNLDNDVNGYLDVIVTSYTGNSVYYMIGNGDGTFGSLSTLGTGTGPGSIDNIDFDQDGDLDVVVAYTGSGDIIVYENRLDTDSDFLPFDNAVDTGNGFLWTVSFADINDDSRLDIIKSDNNPSGVPNVAWYSYDDSDMSGNPTTSTTWTENNVATSIQRTAMASVADFNNDMDNDLLVTNGRSTDNDFIWFESDNAGGLGLEDIIDDSSPTGFDIEIEDFDNDGDLDIAGISYLQDDLYIFINDHITLGVEEQSLETISIFPNPTTNQLFFNVPTLDTLNIRVYNVLGKNILTKSIESNQFLDVSNLSNGIYIIRLEDYNQSFKFVKE